jgi:hypothetical protein
MIVSLHDSSLVSFSKPSQTKLTNSQSGIISLNCFIASSLHRSLRSSSVSIASKLTSDSSTSTS